MISIQPEEMQIIDYVFDRFGEFILFDVGAAEGEYTDVVKERCGFIEAHLFEPRSAAVLELREHFAEDPTVIINRCALGDIEGPDHVVLASDDLHHSHLRGVRAGEDYEAVQIRTLDEYLGSQVWASSMFLKIDTEGFEMPVMLGAKEAIASGMFAAIQFEYGGTWPSTRYWRLKDAVDLLQGYTIFEPLNGAMRPIMTIEDDYEYRNYLAVRD